MKEILSPEKEIELFERLEHITTGDYATKSLTDEEIIKKIQDLHEEVATFLIKSFIKNFGENEYLSKKDEGVFLINLKKLTNEDKETTSKCVMELCEHYLVEYDYELYTEFKKFKNLRDIVEYFSKKIYQDYLEEKDALQKERVMLLEILINNEKLKKEQQK